MCYIELKNDKYETLEDLKHLLQYILRLDKTAEDSQRANTITNTLAGCQPAMIPNEYLCDPSAVYHLMLFAVRRRQKGTTQFAKHRIVSFAATDCILPQDVVSLAERIASIYARNGFITAYGIHADRFNVHIHFAVCAVSFQTQNMFHADFDAGYAFASSLAKIGIIGGLGAFLAADAAFAFGSWAFLFGIGGQIALFANFLGPIGIVAGALISAGLGIMKLFGGGWEKSVAKKLVNAYEEKGVTDQYRKAINEYWAQTETAFDQAAEQLDQAWTAYVERLQTTVDSYDIEQIETSLTAAKGIQNFFEHIPL